MNVSKDVLHAKLQQIVPDLISGVNPDSLNPICDSKATQPFLQWFVNNVTEHNFLSDEDDNDLAEHIKKSGDWLEGEELNAEWENALLEYPELEDLFLSPLTDLHQPIPDYELQKEQFQKEQEYYYFLQEQYKKLTKTENEAEEELEKIEKVLEKQQAEVELSYNKCFESLEEFNAASKEVFASLKYLFNIYGSSTDQYGKMITWAQVPVDVIIKQLNTYSNYLEIYMKKQFGDKLSVFKTDDDQTIFNISESSNIDDMSKLSICKNTLSKAKFQEINNKIEQASWKTSVQFLETMYNGGKLLDCPQNSRQFRLEITEMMRKRSYLDENIEMLNVQLRDAAENFGEAEANKFLIEVTKNKIEQRQEQLAKIDELKVLASVKGHAYVDFLCVVMSSQQQKITNLTRFAQDAQHHFQTEYSLSEKRFEIMRKLQDEYTQLFESSSGEQNVFNALFLNMMGCSRTTDIYTCIQNYEALADENTENFKFCLQNICIPMLQEISAADNNFSKTYLQELDNGSTRTFQTTSSLISSKMLEMTSKVETSQMNFEAMHNKFKEANKKINDFSLEREKAILWQIFLADPNLLVAKFEELKSQVENPSKS